MIELKSTIIRCLKRCKPPVDLYVKNEDEFNVIRDGVVADIENATEELEHEIGNYLMAKEAEINSKLVQTKCEAYELALTHTRPTERISEGQECSA